MDSLARSPFLDNCNTDVHFGNCRSPCLHTHWLSRLGGIVISHIRFCMDSNWSIDIKRIIGLGNSDRSILDWHFYPGYGIRPVRRKFAGNRV